MNLEPSIYDIPHYHILVLLPETTGFLEFQTEVAGAWHSLCCSEVFPDKMLPSPVKLFHNTCNIQLCIFIGSIAAVSTTVVTTVMVALTALLCILYF